MYDDEQYVKETIARTYAGETAESIIDDISSRLGTEDNNIVKKLYLTKLLSVTVTCGKANLFSSRENLFTHPIIKKSYMITHLLNLLKLDLQPCKEVLYDVELISTGDVYFEAKSTGFRTVWEIKHPIFGTLGEIVECGPFYDRDTKIELDFLQC